MKNYPNQAAEFPRVRATLATILDLNTQQADVLDDGVLGYELATRRHYTFRGVNYATVTDQQIQARIQVERQKDSGSQGARTNARELRRTLHGLGWIDNTGIVTQVGEDLLATTPGSQDERDLLVTGLMNITAVDRTGMHVHHPVPMLLHLLNARPSHRRQGLELALEPLDDSQAERQRVLTLYNTHTTDAAVRTATGVTESQQKNSRKVFPSLARYAGLVVEDQQNYFRITPAGLALIQQPVPQPAAPAQVPPTPPAPPAGGGGNQGGQPGAGVGRRNLTTGAQRAAGQVGGHAANRNVPQALTPDQQAQAQNRLNERTTAHQELVRVFAEFIGDENGEFWEDQASFDLVWGPTDSEDRHLFEMKTIQADADAQIVRAVGQLAYYEHFNVAAAFPNATSVTKTVVVDGDLHDELTDFLQKLGIGAISVTPEQGPQGLNQLGEDLLALLPQN